MVQLMSTGHLKRAPESPSCPEKRLVKLEISEDLIGDEYGPPSKRSKPSPNLEEQWSSKADESESSIPPSQYNPLDEPSPLGLRLRKSPSLLELIQMRLSQSHASKSTSKDENLSSGIKKEPKSNAGIDKLKASNFPASFLKIGRWEYKSRYEGDLVAKCYFAKHKLVWEVLEGGLKSKVEIQWSDIMALKASCPDNAPGTLTVVLARQPLFFRETNPQPRKHTLWQATSDFTDGQASMHRKHFLQVPQGLLNKHFEKLIQCDMRLNFLSRQPEITLSSPYFEPRNSVFEDSDLSKEHSFGHVGAGKGSNSSGVQSMSSPAGAQSSSLDIEKCESSGVTSEPRSLEAPSPSSVMIDNRDNEAGLISETSDPKVGRIWDQIKVPGLHQSMSMSDLMNHIESCLSEQMGTSNQSSGNISANHEMLEEIAQYLLSDTQFATPSDEKCLMSRVNSLCCLLQKDTSTSTNLQMNGEDNKSLPDDGRIFQMNRSPEQPDTEANVGLKESEGDTNDFSGGRTGMSRKDSFGDLLLHLPRIASLPKFLFNISEDSENQTKG